MFPLNEDIPVFLY